MDDSPKKKLRDQASPEISDDDAIGQFCSEINLDEIEFESWCDSNSGLDLTIPFTVCRAALPPDRVCEVSFTRTIRWSEPDGTVGQRREKVVVQAKIPENSCDGDCLEMSGEGDRHDDEVGTLKLRLCLS